MARVSLILPVAPGVDASDDRIVPFRRVLEDAGHQVEMIVVADPRSERAPRALGEPVRTLVADRPGCSRGDASGAPRGDRRRAGRD